MAAVLQERLTQRARALTPAQLRLFGIIAGGAILFVIGAGYLLGRTPYSVAFANLTPASAGQVTQALTSLKIPYQLAAGGSVIEVPTAQADQARIDLAQQGLPSTGQASYTNLTSITSAGLTSQQFSAAQVGILEQDLAGTLSTMAGVRSAEVQIAEPPTSIFSPTATTGAKASVFLALNPGYSAPASEVKGVVSLVADAVPGLRASSVTVVNQAGVVLNAPGAGANAPSSVLAYEQKVETTDDLDLLSYLGPVVGVNNVQVAVHAQVSSTTTSTQLNTPIKPGTPVTQSQSTSTYKGSPQTNATAGTTANTAPTVALGTTGTNTSGTSTSTKVTYAVGHKVQTITGPPLQITNVTASVLINSTGYPLNAVRTAAIRALVAAALGVPVANVTLSAMPFAAAPKPATTTVPAFTLTQFQQYAIPALVALILILGGLLVGSRRGRGAIAPGGPQLAGAGYTQGVAGYGAPQGAEGMIGYNAPPPGEGFGYVEPAGFQPAEANAFATGSGSTAGGFSVDTSEDSRRREALAQREQELRRAISDLGEQSPGDLAALLSAWVNEDGSHRG